MKNSIFLFIALCGLHLQTISAQGEFVVTPFETDATSQQDIMDAVYASCTETFFETGSTVNFVLDGCDAPVLVSMDLLRSSGDLFDPTGIGRDEILIDPTTSSAQFDEDGMFVVFCDDSFKTVGGCFTITSDLALLGVAAEPVPTLGAWGMIHLSILLVILGLNYLRARQQDTEYFLD